jgi:hypothetical protein
VFWGIPTVHLAGAGVAKDLMVKCLHIFDGQINLREAAGVMLRSEGRGVIKKNEEV